MAKVIQPKVFIQDSLTNEFYSIKMTEVDFFGQPTVGENDLPFWSKSTENAIDFGSEGVANHEINMNDLTFNDTRNPVIVKL